MNTKADNELVSNRRARHDYEILETYEAGIVLQGTEIKSLRNHGGSLQDAYVNIERGTAVLKGSSIAPYRFGNIFNHEEKRDRLLLLHKREIVHIKKALEVKGLTLIPLVMYLKKGYVKVLIGVARGKKQFDKRATLKKREHERSMQRAIKEGLG